MKQKVIHFVGGFIMYAILASLLILIFDIDMPNQWGYIISWAVCMSLFEMFVITPLRKKLTAKKQ
ncbi:hypothetical protein E0W68_01375 [Flavobacterium salilacus subsp. salilacus]|uniref:hypothetical protein n=1 Tax=Flavobacterium TaxID=237 RepID=UPI001074BCDF|nr:MULTISPECIES: hypothetical protein [Flavobacterium]KAF2519907.1 hypothetical protein E0W68_01375 [Flavobacterium salilacus subsp. salilacus]MBE1614185.1 hypothetical protein [Flavobacterium sp. SaA2.13]NDI97732.1 hypothetical protein [Flavobacterium salilacus subsp. altitudinum]